MANLIIKSSANDLVIQGSDESPAITVAAAGTTTFAEATTLSGATTCSTTLGVTGNTTLSGTANALGTVTSGNLSNSAIVYPSGHIINKKLLANENDQVGHLSTTSSSYVDSGIFGAYTPLKSSSVTWLNVHLHWGFTQSSTHTTMTDCTMDDTNSTSHTNSNSMGGDTYSNQSDPHNLSPTYNWIFNTVASGLVQVDRPDNQTSYTAGTPYYFRIYVQTTGGTFYFVHDGGYYNFYIEEIML